MPWKASSVMEERLRFVARLLDGETMTDVCREFGVSRKTGYKIFDRYKEHGLEALSDRSRRPVRYANQLPEQIEGLIVRLKAEKPHWGARKIRELLVRRLDGDIRVPAKAPSMPSSTAMAWSSAAAGRATARIFGGCFRQKARHQAAGGDCLIHGWIPPAFEIANANSLHCLGHSLAKSFDMGSITNPTIRNAWFPARVNR